MKDKPFALIGANTITLDVKKLKAVMLKEQLPWRAVARSDAINALWNNPGTPSYYVIDHKGVIRHKWVGVAPPEVVDAAIAKCIAAAAKDGGR